MMVIFGTLSGVYIIPTIYEDYASLEYAARNRDKSSLEDGSLPQQAANVDDFARNSINYVYNKTKQLKANSSVVSFGVICCIFGDVNLIIIIFCRFVVCVIVIVVIVHLAMMYKCINNHDIFVKLYM